MRIKKFTTMMLAGMLALPALASAADADLEKRVKELESKLATVQENSESWDMASRIQWSGDFRFRADYISADAPAQYSALGVATGVSDFYKLNAAFGKGFGTLTPTQQGSLMGATLGDVLMSMGGGAPHGSCDGNCLAGLGSLMGGLTPAQQATMGTMLPMMNSGMTFGQLAGAFGSTFASPTNTQPVVDFMKSFNPAQRKALFAALGYQPTAATTYKNDTTYTNRFRLNMRAKAMENLEFKARLAMYKIWGMQSNAVDPGTGGGPFMLSSLAFDGSSSRQPKDSVLRVDRAYMNWNAIGGSPFWFSIGRRPVTDGPPSHLRQGTGEKMATPVAYMDYPFDGTTLGYAYENLFGIQDAPGRVRFCYGRGFEAGPTASDVGLNDVDFGGISWDVYDKGNRFFYFQSFGAFNMFNVPGDVSFTNPIEYAMYKGGAIDYDPMNSSKNLVLDRANLGNIYHTSSVYMSKVQNLNYFLTAGWSRTDARSMDELGNSLLGSWGEEPKDHDGYSVYMGVRYDLDSLGLKLGAEYNWGSQYWISFTPGHDDLYASKLATRGSVVELYTIYDIPAGAAISKYSKAFVRLGYQHYDYQYTGSGFWLGAPQKIDELANDPMNAQFYSAVESADQAYLTMEAWF